jgi:hypothetical protein
MIKVAKEISTTEASRRGDHRIINLVSCMAQIKPVRDV